MRHPRRWGGGARVGVRRSRPGGARSPRPPPPLPLPRAPPPKEARPPGGGWRKGEDRRHSAAPAAQPRQTKGARGTGLAPANAPSRGRYAPPVHSASNERPRRLTGRRTWHGRPSPLPGWRGPPSPRAPTNEDTRASQCVQVAKCVRGRGPSPRTPVAAACTPLHARHSSPSSPSPSAYPTASHPSGIPSASLPRPVRVLARRIPPTVRQANSGRPVRLQSGGESWVPVAPGQRPPTTTLPACGWATASSASSS